MTPNTRRGLGVIEAIVGDYLSSAVTADGPIEVRIPGRRYLSYETDSAITSALRWISRQKKLDEKRRAKRGKYKTEVR